MGFGELMSGVKFISTNSLGLVSSDSEQKPNSQSGVPNEDVYLAQNDNPALRMPLRKSHSNKITVFEEDEDVNGVSADEYFNSLLKNLKGDRRIIVLFSMQGCKPCKAYKPKFRELAKKCTNSRLNFMISNNADIAMTQSIKSFPTLMEFGSGGNKKKISYALYNDLLNHIGKRFLTIDEQIEMLANDSVEVSVALNLVSVLLSKDLSTEQIIKIEQSIFNYLNCAEGYELMMLADSCKNLLGKIPEGELEKHIPKYLDALKSSENNKKIFGLVALSSMVEGFASNDLNSYVQQARSAIRDSEKYYSYNFYGKMINRLTDEEILEDLDCLSNDLISDNETKLLDSIVLFGSLLNEVNSRESLKYQLNKMKIISESVFKFMMDKALLNEKDDGKMLYVRNYSLYSLSFLSKYLSKDMLKTGVDLLGASLQAELDPYLISAYKEMLLALDKDNYDEDWNVFVGYPSNSTEISELKASALYAFSGKLSLAPDQVVQEFKMILESDNEKVKDYAYKFFSESELVEDLSKGDVLEILWKIESDVENIQDEKIKSTAMFAFVALSIISEGK